jgi:hypothetical protein
MLVPLVEGGLEAKPSVARVFSSEPQPRPVGVSHCPISQAVSVSYKGKCMAQAKLTYFNCFILA